MQAIDRAELARNRDWLVSWQKQRWSENRPGLRLHLGSGKVRLSLYINVDPYREESDLKADMRSLPHKDNSVSEIVCHHALEHIPIRDVYPTMKHWYQILEPGGTIELGLPDLELCAQMFLEASETERWQRYIWTIYGAQSDTEEKTGWNPREHTPFDPSQVHYGGYSMGYFIRMLEDIGFKMLSAYNYDGYGTPSFFILAEKPDTTNYPEISIYEKDVVIGTFTHRTKYIEELWRSARKFIPHIPFVSRIQRGPINKGMSMLREDFIKTGKRYWCFLDDDIQFLNKDIIGNAVEALIKNKFTAISVYSTFDKKAITEPYDPEKYELITRSHKWATGYFIMVDSHKVGHILPDMNLPEPNTSVDTSYSAAIRAEGHVIGISADYVFHEKKPVISRPHIIEQTNKYLMEKWGQFYFDCCQYDYNVIEWGKKGNS